MMHRLYIYETNTKEIICTITNEDEDTCKERAALILEDSEGYEWTFTPNFGEPDGLVYREDVDVINYGADE